MYLDLDKLKSQGLCVYCGQRVWESLGAGNANVHYGFIITCRFNEALRTDMLDRSWCTATLPSFSIYTKLLNGKIS